MPFLLCCKYFRFSTFCSLWRQFTKTYQQMWYDSHYIQCTVEKLKSNLKWEVLPHQHSKYFCCQFDLQFSNLILEWSCSSSVVLLIQLVLIASYKATVSSQFKSHVSESESLFSQCEVLIGTCERQVHVI